MFLLKMLLAYTYWLAIGDVYILNTKYYEAVTKNI